jgi:cytochrome c oxidase subunit 2
MKKAAIVLLLSILLLAVFLLASVVAQEQPAPEPPAEDKSADSPVREIKMTAKKYEFNPGEIRVKQGERVRLIIVSLDRTHGIQIKPYGIKREIDEGGQTVVEFIADKPGTFQFKCAKWCGFGHGRMRGTLIVEPTDGPAASEEQAAAED